MNAGDAFAEFAAALATRGLAVRFVPPGEATALAGELTEIRAQVDTLKEIIMSIVSDFKTFTANANATMAAAVLTMQQLRQGLDAANEALALAPPALPAGAVVLSAAEVADLAAATASLDDSRQAVADAIEANAPLQAAPVAPTTP